MATATVDWTGRPPPGFARRARSPSATSTASTAATPPWSRPPALAAASAARPWPSPSTPPRYQLLRPGAARRRSPPWLTAPRCSRPPAPTTSWSCAPTPTCSRCGPEEFFADVVCAALRRAGGGRGRQLRLRPRPRRGPSRRWRGCAGGRRGVDRGAAGGGRRARWCPAAGCGPPCLRGDVAAGGGPARPAVPSHGHRVEAGAAAAG